jgi:catalase
MSEEAKQRLVENISGSLSRVSRNEIIERSIGHFRKAAPDYGKRVAAAVAALRKSRTR